MTSGIYGIYNMVSMAKYVGSAKNIRSRIFQQHLWRLNRGVHENSHLQHAWDKYGPEAFVFGIIEECPVEDLFDRENVHLEVLRILDWPKYNMNDNADRPPDATGRRHTDETRLKMSLAKLGSKMTDVRLGKKKSETMKANLRAAKLGKPQSEETKAKRAESLRQYHARKRSQSGL